MLHLATYFDINYLSRGLVLYESLKKHCYSFDLYVLCLDNSTSEYFLKKTGYFPEIIALSINELEEFDPGFKECKKNRNDVEYYFTLSPCLPLYLLKEFNVPHICSLDADIMFFSSPDIILQYLEHHSILITPHNFSPELKSLEIYGRYNVSFQIFKNDENGLKCLETWRKQCIDWCYDRLEDGKYADQKYLDNWVKDFKDVWPIDITGIGVAPWNLNYRKITVVDNQIYIDNSKLIFYHFHGLRLINEHLIIHGMSKYGVRINKIITRHLYKPYIRGLLAVSSGNDSEIKRHIINQETPFETIFYQKNWYYYKAGRLFKKDFLFDLIGRTFNYIRSRVFKRQN